MNISAMMGKQVAELQQVLSMNLMKSQLATQTAQAVVMLKDMSDAAPHPTLGKSIDTSA